MSDKPAELIIGLKGWKHSHWIGGFYPEDLPPDWWFSYYSNEFHSVLLPFDYLTNTDEQEVQDWVDDSDDSFRFFLELPMSAEWDNIKGRVEILNPQTAAIVLAKQINGADDMHLTESLLQNTADVAPLITNWDNAKQQIIPLLHSYNVGCYWTQTPLPACESNAPVAMIETEPAAANNPMRIRKLLESCLSVQGPSTIGVFFAGVEPDFNQARNAAMIYQMLV